MRIDGAIIVGGGDINFTLVTDNGKVYFRISREALEDHFGASEVDPLSAFNANRHSIGKRATEIWKVAERQGVKTTSQDRLILKSANF
jgi:hypothetical protein